MMILVTGGARSGKSRHAEVLIGDSSQAVSYTHLDVYKRQVHDLIFQRAKY